MQRCRTAGSAPTRRRLGQVAQRPEHQPGPGVLLPALLEPRALLVGDSRGRGDDERFGVRQAFGVGQVVGAPAVVLPRVPGAPDQRPGSTRACYRVTAPAATQAERGLTGLCLTMERAREKRRYPFGAPVASSRFRTAISYWNPKTMRRASERLISRR
ncbi:hypothetical protein EDD91_7899 [Streptomyces sp. KS 21]|nr:hypothetical protein EDD91_7899 [Streptomyces sp. KS 21]